KNFHSHPWETVTKAAMQKYPNPMNPNDLWNYTMQTSAYVGNRCFSRRTKETPYELFTGRKPDVFKMQRFKSICFAYKQKKGKLECRCKKGVFIGYDKNSPAYLVYYPNTEKVQKDRNVLTQETILSVKGVSLSSYLEGLMANTISTNAGKGREAMECVISRLNAEFEELTLTARGTMRKSMAAAV
ncbi:PRELI domain containing protein 3B, partial [Silurus asotus]